MEGIKQRQKSNSFKESVPIINKDERTLRSQIKGTLTIVGHSKSVRNSFINDSKKIWNQCPDEITKNINILPPKALIKKFVNTLPL